MRIVVFLFFSKHTHTHTRTTQHSAQTNEREKKAFVDCYNRYISIYIILQTYHLCVRASETLTLNKIEVNIERGKKKYTEWCISRCVCSVDKNVIDMTFRYARLCSSHIYEIDCRHASHGFFWLVSLPSLIQSCRSKD